MNKIINIDEELFKKNKGQTPKLPEKKLPEKLFWQFSGKYLILKNH